MAGFGAIAGAVHNPAFEGLMGRGKARIAPVETPDIAALNEMFVRGIINKETHQKMAKWVGWDFEDGIYPKQLWYDLKQGGDFLRGNKLDLDDGWAGNTVGSKTGFLTLGKWNPEPEMLFEMYRRGLITDRLFAWWMQQLGINEGELMGAVSELRLIIPEVDELIRFGTRHAFDPDIIKKYEFANEVPPTILPWVAKKGLDMPVGFNKPASVRADGTPDPERPATWFDLYWFAHWVYPSLTDGYTMLQRLYPKSPHGASPLWNGGNEWTEEDMNRLLRAQDVPTYFRDRLMTIAYNPLSRVDIRRMYQSRVLNKDEVYHAYRQIGYNDQDAERLLRFTVVQAEEKNSDAKYELAKQKVCKYYGQGILTRDAAMEALELAGLNRNQAEIFMATCDIDTHAEQVAAQIKLLKEAFLVGIYSIVTIREPLVNLGIRPDIVELRVQEWTMEREIKRKEPNAAIFIQWLVDGFIGEQEVIARMQNLNYDPVYITNTLQTARLRIAKEQDKELGKAIKDRTVAVKKALSDREKTLREQGKAVKDAFKAMVSASTEKNLKTWLSKGLIDPETVFERLLIKGWDEADAMRWLQATGNDIAADRQKQIAAQAKAHIDAIKTAAALAKIAKEEGTPIAKAQTKAIGEAAATAVPHAGSGS